MDQEEWKNIGRHFFRLLRGQDRTYLQVDQDAIVTNPKPIKKIKPRRKGLKEGTIFQFQEDKDKFFKFTKDVLANIIYHLHAQETSKDSSHAEHIDSLKKGLLEITKTNAFNCKKQKKFDKKIKNNNEKFSKSGALAIQNTNDSQFYKKIDSQLNEIAGKLYQTSISECLEKINNFEIQFSKQERAEITEKLNKYINEEVISRLDEINKNGVSAETLPLPKWSQLLKREERSMPTPNLPFDEVDNHPPTMRRLLGMQKKSSQLTQTHYTTSDGQKTWLSWVLL